MNHPLSKKLLIFDADGTLRRCLQHKGPCHSDAGQWELIPGVKETLVNYCIPEVFDLAIATNQAGISLGHRTIDDVILQLQILIMNYFPSTQICRVPIFVCPHDIVANCSCRKPNPGMLLAAMQHSKCGTEDTVFIGDSEDDRGAAARAHVDFYYAHHFFGWEHPYDL